MRGWLWMARRFGVRTTWRYWREGQRRGWMTKAQAEVALNSLAGLTAEDLALLASGPEVDASDA